jgi:hypothetical protein
MEMERLREHMPWIGFRRFSAQWFQSNCCSPDRQQRFQNALLKMHFGHHNSQCGVGSDRLFSHGCEAVKGWGQSQSYFPAAVYSRARSIRAMPYPALK